METALIRQSRDFARQALSNLPPGITYHTFDHTADVATAAADIASHSGLNEHDTETVIVAAWFHDCGYQNGHYQHEATSARMAAEKLAEWGVAPERIQQVKQAIESTRLPQVPKSMIDSVLCDADLYHLATEDAEEHAKRLRDEMVNDRNFQFSDAEWEEFNLRFLKSHRYFTPYGQTVLEERKKKVIKKLKKKVKAEPTGEYVKNLEEELAKLTKKLDKKANPERGIETMFRIASENHITLSSMADTKSNIMISINSIILSVVVTVLFRKLEEFPALLIPTLILVIVCLLAIVFAVLAARPQVSSGKFTKDDIEKRKTNLLFFGNFHNMEQANYEWGMKQMVKDADYLYGSLIKDIYYNGKVLARKYKFLRLSYTIFMVGFVASIIGFVIALLLFYIPS